MTDEVEGKSLHEDPHFKNNGACDCVCDTCMFGTDPRADYICICPGCNGKCGSSHELPTIVSEGQ